MNQHAQVILLQLVKAMKSHEWVSNNQWELSLKADGYVPMMRQVNVRVGMDKDKWKDQISVMLHLSITSEDEITFFPSITIYAQIALGSIPEKDIEYSTAGNEAFTEKDVQNQKKFKLAAAELTRIVENHVNEVYKQYIEDNRELIRFYKAGTSGPAV